MMVMYTLYREQGIFDLRYTVGNKDELAAPVVAFPKSLKGIHSAFFSPSTGQYALSTCVDDTVKVFHIQPGSAKPECKITTPFSNFQIDE